ncbi:MAG: IPT/TIG domain-containing protein [Candidatus Roizmanbacteria bacterium]
MSVDSSTMELFVKYPGAWSDTYSVMVVSSSYGTLDSTGITFIALGTITSFSPTSGSIYGGTLLTITGHTFSSTITDNPV